MPHPRIPPMTRSTTFLEERLRAAGLLSPPWLTPADVRAAFRLRTESGARKAILRGDFGPYVRRGRRLYVLKESLLAHLHAQRVDPLAGRAEGSQS